MTPAAYEAFMARKGETEVACSCKHGHFDCSDREGGPCCDEEYPQAWRDEERSADMAA